MDYLNAWAEETRRQAATDRAAHDSELAEFLEGTGIRLEELEREAAAVLREKNLATDPPVGG